MSEGSLGAGSYTRGAQILSSPELKRAVIVGGWEKVVKYPGVCNKQGGGLVKCSSNAYVQNTKVTPLSFLNVTIIGTTVSYVISISDGNFSLFSPHLEIQVLGPSWAIPSWFKIDKEGWGGVAIGMPWCIFFVTKIS